MRILIYGGSFNPPHRGHVSALEAAAKALSPERILVIPDNIPPHKELADGSPTAAQRLSLCTLAFSGFPGVEVSDIELRRQGKSYTVETLREISKENPDAELYFLLGTDMLLSMESWYEFRDIFSLCTLAALPRNEDEEVPLAACAERLRLSYGARVILIPKVPLPMNSTSLRGSLGNRLGRDELPDAVYCEIIRFRYYGARPALDWLREKAYAWLKPKRIAHVQGCEEEAVRLAEHWGQDAGEAAEAAILHDITKKLSPAEQLRLCEKYDIMTDAGELAEPKLLHARTGAYIARDLFGVSDGVFNAIQWHTTGCPGMSALDKIIYLADFTEPTRDFPGLEQVRALTFADLDQAMITALRLSMDEVRSRGAEPHRRSLDTLDWLINKE